MPTEDGVGRSGAGMISEKGTKGADPNCAPVPGTGVAASVSSSGRKQQLWHNWEECCFPFRWVLPAERDEKGAVPKRRS